jgi:hypothetical protein
MLRQIFFDYTGRDSNEVRVLGQCAHVYHRNSIDRMNSQPTNATQARDRLYAQLARSLTRMSGAIAKTADLCELLQVDLDAMRRLGGLHAAQ